MSRIDTHDIDGAHVDAIMEGAHALSVPLEATAARHLAWLVARLCHWNRRIRIMGPCTPLEAIERHILDGLMLLRILDRPEVRERTTTWCDVGAGAGLPGLVLAIARPSLAITLIEPVGKKIAFAQEIVHALDLDQVEVRVARMENIAPPVAPTGVLSRATFAPTEWLARGRAWVEEGNLVLVLMGPTPPQEVVADAWIVDRLRLPTSGAHRTNTLHRIG